MKNIGGYSLINLLFSLSIGVVLASTAVAEFGEVVRRNETTSTSKTLLRIINFARLEAVNRGESIVICPSTDSETCTNDWSEELLVFSDSNQDEAFQPAQDKLLFQTNLISRKTSINWRSFGSKPYLSFNSFGYTGYQNGRIYICDSSENYKSQIIVYRSGRARYATDEELKDRCS